MKKLLTIAFLSFLMIGCKNDETFVTLSGTIENAENSEIKLVKKNDREPLRIFMLDDKSTFKDTITLESGDYYLVHDKGYMMLNLNPGDHVTITAHADDFMKTLKVDGGNESINNYYLEKNNFTEQAYYDLKEFYHLDQEAFKVKFDSIKEQYSQLIDNVKDPNPEFLKYEQQEMEDYFNFISQDYNEKKEQAKMIGQPSPSFEKYENYNGGTTSLSDLKGKYTYIDVWATWCRPCREEIPALKILEGKYGEQINFVSISVDKPKDRDKWLAMVKDLDLRGYQLFANSDKPTTFDQDYNISSIPRFIIVDPQGNVFNPDAPRPSETKTEQLLQSLINN